MNDERTRSRYVPPEPGATPASSPSLVDSKAEASKSPAFVEALKKDDEREANSDFSPDKDLWGRSGAGADVVKKAPESSQRTEEKRADREEGYGD
jgi:hypothetical protein